MMKLENFTHAVDILGYDLISISTYRRSPVLLILQARHEQILSLHRGVIST